MYEELVEKCHPNKFIDGDNFDENLFEKANKLYAEILKHKDASDEKLISLRNRAIDILGVRMSTKKKYEYEGVEGLHRGQRLAMEPQDLLRHRRNKK